MTIVSAAVIIANGRILLTRRKAGENLAGCWEFPGGKMEEGETLQSCLERELREELGLLTRVGEILAESEHVNERGSFKLIALKTEIIGGQLKLTVHDRAEWVSPGDLKKYPLAPADIPIAEIIMRTTNGGA